MKKLLALIILAVVISCFVLSGCSLFSSFKIVSNITLVVGDKEINRASYARLIGGHAWVKHEPATRYEYENVDEHYKVSGESFLYDLTLDTSKTITSFRGLTEADYGQYIYWRIDQSWGTSFLKYKFCGWEYIYLHVKIINDNKLVVYVDPASEAESTTYVVTSYRIGNELK